MPSTEQVVMMITGIKKTQPGLLGIRSAIQNQVSTVDKTLQSLETLQKALNGLLTQFEKLQQNPEYKGAPVQELMNATKQMIFSLQQYKQLLLSLKPTAQETDHSTDSLILALEAMSKWLTTREVFTDPLLEYKCPQCRAAIQPQDTFCGNCGKLLLPTTDMQSIIDTSD